MQIRKIVPSKHSLFFILVIITSNAVSAQTLNKDLHSHKGWSLFGALTLNNQSINDAGITAPINYLYNSENNNAFKAGYSGGFRWDGVINQQHRYSLIFSANRVSTGTNYEHKYTLAPFIEDFTHFKADNQFTNLSFAAHYKMLLPVNDMQKFKFYAVLGPSIDYKITMISSENLINGAGNRAYINGDLGAEFDNKGYYILYAHYKLGANLLSSSVSIQMNRLEMGMSIKLKDLF